MIRRTTPILAASAGLATMLLGVRPASAEIPLVQYDGWKLSTDGRVNAFISVAAGSGIPQGEPDFLGAGTEDTATATNDLHSTRIRNGFLMSILGFTGVKEVSRDFRVTTRVGVWMNASGSRTKNVSALVDPRELWAMVDGRWGSLLGGSDLSLFGRGGILVDYRIAHEYGLGYPCSIRDASGGACGMVGFGAPFPGYDPGFVYATPSLAGFKLSVGLYDPATIDNASLDRAPLPRVEGELKFDYKEAVKLFVSGFWQVLEGTVQNPQTMGQKDLHAEGWGVQAGGMLSLGPIMLGGAAYQGAGFSPIQALDESALPVDSAGVLRNSRGAFGLGAVLVDALNVKVAGGAGLFYLDKNKNDAGTTSSTGSPADPKLIKQNLGITAGIYQTTGPVHFALEYFRAEQTWYERGVASATNPSVTVAVNTPQQVVNFINAGMTVVW
jgi:hypothetical protein